MPHNHDTTTAPEKQNRFRFDVVPFEETGHAWQKCAACDGPMNSEGKLVRYHARHLGQYYIFAVVNLCAECGKDESAVKPFAEVRCEKFADAPDMWSRAFMFGVETPRGRYVDEPARCPKCGSYFADHVADGWKKTDTVYCLCCGKFYAPSKERTDTTTIASEKQARTKKDETTGSCPVCRFCGSYNTHYLLDQDGVPVILWCDKCCKGWSLP